MTRGSDLILVSFNAIPVAEEMRWVSPVFWRRWTSVILKGPSVVGWRVSTGVSVLAGWMEGLAALLRRASAVWIRIRHRAPERRTGRGRWRLIVFIHVQRIGVLVLIHGLLESIHTVFVVLINRASWWLCHGGL